MELVKLSLVLISVGIVFMLLAVLKTRNILNLLKGKTEIYSWKILFFLMIFFLVGYLAAIYLIVNEQQKMIGFLTGLVFFLGSVFVFIMARVSSVTINDLILKDKTDVLNQELKKNEIILKQKSEELVNTNKELEDERKQLEYKIEERTSELKSVNIELNNEIEEHKKSEKELAENKDRLEKQNKALHIVTKCLKVDDENFDKSIPEITKIAAETLDVERVSLWLYDETKTSIKCIDLYESSKKTHTNGVVLSAKNYPAYFKALEINRVIDANDAPNDPRTFEYSETYLKPLGITSMLDVPIRRGGQMVGIVCFEHVGSQRNWTIDEQLFGGAIADSISILLESIDRIKAEKVLQEKEKQLSSIYDTVGDAIFQLAIEKEGRYKFVSVNKSFKKITGIESNNVLGKYIDEIIPQPSLSIVLDKYNKAILDKKIIRWEEVSDYPTGQLTGEVSVAPVFDENGNCTFLVGSVHDITERKKNEEVIKTKTNQLNDAQQLAHVGSWEWDVLANKIEWSDEMYRIYGLIPQEFEPTYESFLKYIHPDDKENVNGIVHQALKDHKPFNFLNKIIQPNGTVHILNCSGNVVTDSNGNAIRMVGTAHDVTDLKNSENKIKQLNEELEEKVKERTSALLKTQESLQLSEEKYRKIVEEAGDVVYSSDYNGNFTYVNPTSKKLTGYEDKELIGKNYLEIIAPEWKEKVKIFYKDQFDKRIQETLFSFPIITKTGEQKWVEQIVTQQHVGDKIIGHQAIVRDITERKKAEDELKNSNERFLKIFQNNAIGMVLVNMETNKFQDVNEFFINKFGYTKEEVIGKSGTEINIIEPESYEKVLTLLQQQGYVKDFEALVRKKNGETFWSISSIQPLKINNQNYFLSSFFDITELKKVEAEVKQKSSELEKSNKELKYSEQQIQSIFDSAPDAVIVINNESHIIKWNHKAEILFGWKESEIIGKPLYEYIIPEHYRERHKAGMKHYLETGEGPVLNKEIEIEAINKKGKEFSVLLSISPVGIKDEKLFIGFVRDITDKKKDELMIIQKSAELERSNKELEQFAYVASHDLQEPLRMVTSYLQLLEKKYKNKLDQDANEFINFAVDGSNRMRNLIMALLDYSRINRVKPFEDINVNEILNVVIGDLKTTIKDTNAVITVEPLPVIFGDKVWIGQLFQNLLSNALKFKGDRNPEIVISGKKNKEEYLFSVKDNGIGIQKEYASKLFIIFQRLNTKEQYPGTGIGLAICKKIVEKHGGKIWFESEFGKGTTFYFTIKEKVENPTEAKPKEEKPKEEKLKEIDKSVVNITA